MVDKRQESNKRIAFSLGPVSAVADVEDATLAELGTLTNVSEATKWDGFDFNLEASARDEDRALTDAVGAAERGYDQYGGNVSFFTPEADDTSSIYRRARNLVSGLHTQLIATLRPGLPASTPWAPGQVYNIFKVITDANRHLRGDKNRFYTIALKSRGAVGVNRIVPSAIPKPVDITPAGPITVGVGESVQLRAEYEGNDITVGARYQVDDQSIAVVTKHGIVIGLTAGSTTVTPSFPGSAAGTPITITVEP